MITTVCETIMLVCFGLSWPISVYKSYTSASTKGKSLFFTIAIIIGYIAGITGKITSGQFNYVLVLYFINLLFVSVDFALYFRNKRLEKQVQAKPVL